MDSMALNSSKESRFHRNYFLLLPSKRYLPQIIMIPTELQNEQHTFDSGAPALVGPFMMTCDDSLTGVTGSCCDVASAILVADDR